MRHARHAATGAGGRNESGCNEAGDALGSPNCTMLLLFAVRQMQRRRRGQAGRRRTRCRTRRWRRHRRSWRRCAGSSGPSPAAARRSRLSASAPPTSCCCRVIWLNVAGVAPAHIYGRPSCVTNSIQFRPARLRSTSPSRSRRGARWSSAIGLLRRRQSAPAFGPRPRGCGGRDFRAIDSFQQGHIGVFLT